MKICFIGSLNIFIYNFAKYYVEKKGFEVFLISRKKSNLTSENFSFIKVFYLKSERLIYKIIKIRQIVKQIKPDIVHCFQISRDAIAPILFFHRKFKYVCSIFGSDFYWDIKSLNKKIIKKYVFDRCDVITFNSFQMKKDLINTFPNIDLNKIKPVMWGIDYDLFNNVNREEIIRKKIELNMKNEKIVLSFRGFNHIYNQDIIFRSIPLILEHERNIKFIFILGNTKLKAINGMVSFLKEKNALKNVIFIERFVSYSELSIFLNLSDIVINIPKTDQFALSLLETMASHSIPVVSNLQVYKDILVNNENAVFLNEINENELVEKIIYIIDNYEKLFEKITKSNNIIVKKKFDFKSQTEKMIDLYY
jgi:glycosyltransferase involved in cell wall biosynthesis